MAGKLDQAQAHWQTAKRFGEENHFWPLVVATLLWQGKAALWQSNHELAAKMIKESLSRRIKMNDHVNLAALLEVLAGIDLQEMDFKNAARLFGASDHYFNLLKNTLTPMERQRRELDLANLQTELGARNFQQYFSDGSSLTDKQIDQLL